MRSWSLNDVEDVLKKKPTDGLFGFVLGDGGVKLLADVLCRPGYQHVTRLNLSHHRLSDRCSADLTTILRLRYVLELDLSNNVLEDKGVVAIARSLDTLVLLDLSSVDFGQVGANGLCSMLRINKVLEQLRVGSCNLGDDLTKRLMEATMDGQSLVRLDLSNNAVKSAGFIGIMQELRRNRSLTSINLCNCLGNAKGGSLLASVLESDTVLKELDINGCNIGDDGVFALAKSLRANKTLQSLRMLWNCNAKGIVAIGEMLKVNDALVELHVSRNDCGPEAALSFLDALKRNNGLARLNMDFVSSTASACADLVKVNKSLKKVRLNGKMTEADEIAIVSMLQFNNTLSDLWLPPVWSSDVTGLCADVVVNNGTILFCGGELVDICKRNRRAHNRARLLCLTLLLIRWTRMSTLSILPKDLMKIIVDMVWMCRVEK